MNPDPDKATEVVHSVIHNPFLAGLLGGIVALRGVPGAAWWERAFNVISAMLVAGYIAPAVAEYLELNTQSMQMACAFIVGLFGLNLIATITSYLATVDISSIVPWGEKGEMKMLTIQAANGIISLAAAGSISWLILSPHVREGIVVKLGLIVMAVSLMATSWHSFSNHVNYTALASAGFSLRAGLLCVIAGILWRRKIKGSWTRATDWSNDI